MEPKYLHFSCLPTSFKWRKVILTLEETAEVSMEVVGTWGPNDEFSNSHTDASSLTVDVFDVGAKTQLNWGVENGVLWDIQMLIIHEFKNNLNIWTQSPRA